MYEPGKDDENIFRTVAAARRRRRRRRGVVVVVGSLISIREWIQSGAF